MAVTTNTFMSAPKANDTTIFRKWVVGVHAALTAVGMVQTADTGQINTATVTAPTTLGSGGYSIWRFNDALQATAPVFFKLDFGVLGSGGIPRLGLQVGTGSDGAGALNGYNLLPMKYSYNSLVGVGDGATTTEFASYCSGDGSFVNLILWPGFLPSGWASGGFTIERSRNTMNTPNGDSLLVMHHGYEGIFSVIGCDGAYGSVQSAYSIYAPISVPRYVNGSTAMGSTTLSKDGMTSPVFPMPCVAPGVVPWVSSACAVVHPGDAGATSVIQVATINGLSLTFRAFPYTYANPNSSVGQGVLADSDRLTSRAHVAIAWVV